MEKSFDVSNSIKGTCKISRTFCAELAPRVIPQSHVNSLHIRKMHTKGLADLIKFSSYLSSYKMGATVRD